MSFVISGRVQLIAVLLLAGCRAHFDPVSSPDADIPTHDASLRRAAWGPPQEVFALTSGTGDDDPSMTADMLELYFASNRSGNGDLYVATRAMVDAPWSAPVPVTAVNSPSQETTSKVSSDGLSLFFASMRLGNADLFVSTRVSRTAPWGTPLPIYELASIGTHQFAASPSNDRRLVYCAGPSHETQQLYVAVRSSSTQVWMPTQLAELSTAASECNPMEPDASTIYFSRGIAYQHDLYTATRAPDIYGPVTALDDLNTEANEDDPWVSADQRVMLFSSDRSGDERIYITLR